MRALPHTVRLGPEFWMMEQQINNWLKAHCLGNYTVAIAWVAFEKEEDAMFFTLSHNV